VLRYFSISEIKCHCPVSRIRLTCFLGYCIPVTQGYYLIAFGDKLPRLEFWKVFVFADLLEKFCYPFFAVEDTSIGEDFFRSGTRPFDIIGKQIEYSGKIALAEIGIECLSNLSISTC
jgi:hypothetical protein